ncbi:NUDIX hydrolase [Nonomuraea sp. SMC257]|uniref:NUDIX hydrolase n=1 Tax=Nonomuraea montanisoli TaxID=2741721 RepID=A0A7Y6IHI4_9ACTN|nr:NUDIX hydrolase [Nonomuraea montanisoli]NUW38261.1 NUDIX hydrolase [Nonomuraea montanisoli]
MTRVLASITVPWIPAPHRLEVALTRRLPPVEQTTSAFAFVLDAAGRTLLTRVAREGRGWDIPGGHLDPGERAADAASRELAEETGLALPPERLSVFAWQRIELTGPAPAGYRYASLTYMVMFEARLAEPGPPTAPPAGSESTGAEWLTPEEVERRCTGQVWLTAHRALLARDSP